MSDKKPMGERNFICRPCKIFQVHIVEIPTDDGLFSELALRKTDKIDCPRCGKDMVREVNAPMGNLVGSGWCDANGQSFSFNKQRQEYKEEKRAKKENTPNKTQG